jgi:hypothetical protein
MHTPNEKCDTGRTQFTINDDADIIRGYERARLEMKHYRAQDPLQAQPLQ